MIHRCARTVITRTIHLAAHLTDIGVLNGSLAECSLAPVRGTTFITGTPSFIAAGAGYTGTLTTMNALSAFMIAIGYSSSHDAIFATMIAESGTATRDGIVVRDGIAMTMDSAGEPNSAAKCAAAA